MNVDAECEAAWSSRWFGCGIVGEAQVEGKKKWTEQRRLKNPPCFEHRIWTARFLLVSVLMVDLKRWILRFEGSNLDSAQLQFSDGFFANSCPFMVCFVCFQGPGLPQDSSNFLRKGPNFYSYNISTYVCIPKIQHPTVCWGMAQTSVFLFPFFFLAGQFEVFRLVKKTRGQALAWKKEARSECLIRWKVGQPCKETAICKEAGFKLLQNWKRDIVFGVVGVVAPEKVNHVIAAGVFFGIFFFRWPSFVGIP